MRAWLALSTWLAVSVLSKCWMQDDSTPLHNAAYRGDPETIRVLLDARADPNTVTKVSEWGGGKTPLQMVNRSEDGDTYASTELLKQAGAKS